MWTARIVLEQMAHPVSAFATLTFKEAPKEVHPLELRAFIKSLKYYYPGPFRWYGVGEYGDQSGRPHYHVALFGVSVMHGAYVEKAWGKGHVDMRQLSTELAAYVAGYVCKKMVHKEDPRLQGRHPEFKRASPGIGASCVSSIAASLPSTVRDVPSVVRVSGQLLPMGRYMQERVRMALGRPKGLPSELSLERSLKLSGRTSQELELLERRRENSYVSAVARHNIRRSLKKI